MQAGCLHHKKYWSRSFVFRLLLIDTNELDALARVLLAALGFGGIDYFLGLFLLFQFQAFGVAEHLPRHRAHAPVLFDGNLNRPGMEDRKSTRLNSSHVA